MGDKSDFLCPIFPIEAVAALLHELGIHTVLQLAEAQFQLTGDFRVLHLPRFFLALLKTQPRSADGDGRRIGLFVGLLLVERNLVHHRVETVVVRAQRVEDFPDHIESLAIVEGFLRRNVGRHDNRDDDVAVLLFVGLPTVERAHHAANRLHHVHLRVTGGKEQHGIERRHVHALGQAAHVGHHAALPVVLRLVGQPLQDFVALLRVHRAVYMSCGDRNGMRKAFRIQILVVLFRNLRQDGSHVFGRDARPACALVYGRAERHGAVHHPWISIPSAVVVALYHFRQPVDYAYQFGRVVKVQFGGRVGDVALDVVRHVVLADGQHKHLVIGQQPVLHGIGEVHAVELLPVEGFVVHRAEDAVLFRCLDFGRFTVQARRGGHIQPLAPLHVVIGVYFGEVALVLVRQLHTRGAVGFVTDDEVENAILAASFGQYLLLRRRNGVNGLVGGEHDH